MVLSKREKLIAVVTLVVVGILVADRFVVGPLLARYDAIEAARLQAEADLREAEQLRLREDRLAEHWAGLVERGLRRDPAATESLVMHALREWSSGAGLSLSSLRPERVLETPPLREVTFRVSGTGSMKQVAGFLYRLETSRLPVRVTELQLGSRKEGTDDLGLQLKVSALCLPEKDPVTTDTAERMAGND